MISIFEPRPSADSRSTVDYDEDGTPTLKCKCGKFFSEITGGELMSFDGEVDC